MNNSVFVYGTLKKGNSIRGLDKFGNARFVDNAVTEDSVYSIYDLGAFPAVTLDGVDRIIGEVWQVDDETFDILDSIEGYPDFYSRMKIKTTAGVAWIYYIPDISEYIGAEKIDSLNNQPVKWGA